MAQLCCIDSAKGPAWTLLLASVVPHTYPAHSVSLQVVAHGLAYKQLYFERNLQDAIEMCVGGGTACIKATVML